MGLVIVPFGSAHTITCDQETRFTTMTIRDTITGDSCSTILQILDPFQVCDGTSSVADFVDSSPTYYNQGILYNLPKSSSKQVLITDLSGQSLFDQKLSAQQDRLDISFLPIGQIFIVRISSGEGMQSLKIFASRS